MNFIFILLFLAVIARRYYYKHRTNLIIQLLEQALVPKTTNKLSRATRTASKTVIIEYTHKEETYEVILPIRSRALGWTQCTATMTTGEVRDVTADVMSKAGPMKDFYGVKLKPAQVYRGASKLVFHAQGRTKPYLVLE